LASDIVIALAAVALAVITLRPGVLKSRRWRATVTPLASIIGSGFLVAGPILSHAAGRWAWVAMAGLCAIGYLFGAAIRRNIEEVEPLLAQGAPPALAWLERASDLALAFAYFISVAYYLNLFAAFGLKGAGVVDPNATRLVATAVIGTIGAVGFLHGLRWMEHIELVAVGIKLALIGALTAALAWLAADAWLHGEFAIPTLDHSTGFAELRVLLGLVILVQGFETSRYLDDEYTAATRIRTMRYAQWLSTAIYVVFILLMTPYFTGHLPQVGGETAIIDMLRPVGTLVAPLIVIAALASQLSAAVADMNGAGGLLGTATPPRFTVRWGYFTTACVAIGVTWAADIFEIITLASKAFVIYYGLQSATAVYVASRRAPRRWGRIAVYSLAVLLALAVVVLGVPAEGGSG
jgi:hypothetical protein